MNPFNRLVILKFSQKLMLAMVMAGLVPALITGMVVNKIAGESITDRVVAQMSSLTVAKKTQVESYFGTIRDQVVTLSQNKMTIDAAKELAPAFNDDTLDADTAAHMRSAMAKFYQHEFANEFKTRNNGTSVEIHSLVPKSAASISAQYRYIAENPNPLGEKHQLDNAQTGSRYDELHRIYHPILRSYLEKFGYYDIFILDPRTGHIIYSVFKELDYGTSLIDGPYADTNFGKAFREAVKLTGENDFVIADYEPYRPSYDAPASFIASPILDSGVVVGVLIFQMPVDHINQIMHERAGLGESGETYLVGSDFLMRSQSDQTEEPTLLRREVRTASTEAIFNGGSGTGQYANYRGTQVLSSYVPLALPGGLEWGVVGEINVDEALSSLSNLQHVIIIVALAAAILCFAFSWWFSRRVLAQLGADPKRLLDVVSAIAEGDLEMDLETGKRPVGVFAGMQTMQKNLRSQIESDRKISAENSRVRQALDKVNSNVMMADVDFNIIYMNDSVRDMFANAESDLRKDLPNFEAKTLLGTNMDVFHQNPAHQRSLVEGLTSTHEAELKIGGRTFAFAANPVVGDNGDRLGTVVEWVDRTAEVAIEVEVDSIVASAKSGDLSKRISLDGKSGFFESLSTGVNDLVDVADRVIGDTVRVLGALAEGHLTETIEADYDGIFGSLKENANHTVAKLTEVVNSIQATANTVSTGATELSQGNANLSQRTEEQASSLEETASSMEEMTSTTTQNADNARQANQLATQARDLAESGGEVVNHAVKAMNDINESSKKISDIIGVIDEIAFQTNLLALNASVEAARAGEQGRGFAVVASEVRNLAGRSATAAKEIKELIQDSGTKVDEGSRLVNESGETLEEIVGAVKKVTDIVAEIAASSQEQSSGIEQVNKAVMQMDEMTQQNAALVEQAAAASKSISDQSSKLDDMMAFFTTQSDAGMPATNSETTVPTERRSQDRPWSGDIESGGTETPTTRESEPEMPQKRSAVGGSTDSEWEEF